MSNITERNRAEAAVSVAKARQSLWTARCEPACQVVWRLGEKNPRLPDYISV